jgi:hypothetical protein
LQFSLLKQEPKERAESRRHHLRASSTHTGCVPQNKIGHIGSFHRFQSERAAAEALQEKLTNERLVFQDRVGDKPALCAQMCFVPVQNLSQRGSVTRQISSWNDVLPSQMIEKLLEGFKIDPAFLVLDKCLYQRLIKVCNCESVPFQPVPQIRDQLHFLSQCPISVALLDQ